MLIRSQDKTCLTNMVQVTDVYCNESMKGTGTNITAALASGDTTHLGTYSTEEKAIKVLDMIEVQYESYSYRYSKSYGYHAIFQMPQDSEV